MIKTPKKFLVLQKDQHNWFSCL